ncbi:MAG TPA: hypothetical protein VGM84_00580 [Steroidobacteraceae bacterium]|jgi:hypothetical protein
MKRLISLCVAALCASLTGPARADDTSNGDISDPSYLPTRHRLIGTTGFGYDKSSGEVDSATGLFDHSFATQGHGWSQLLAYGLTQQLSLGLLYAHANFDSRYEFASGAERSAHPDGTALLLGGSYRLLDQKDRGFNFDLSGVLGSSGSLSAAISRRDEDFTVVARAGLYHVRSGTRFDLVRGSDVTVDDWWGYFANIGAQYRPTRRFGLDFSVGYSSSNFTGGNASTMIAGQDTPFHIKYVDSLNLSIGASLQIIPDRLVAHLSGGYSFLGKRHDDFAGTALDTTTPRRNARGVGLSLTYAIY